VRSSTEDQGAGRRVLVEASGAEIFSDGGGVCKSGLALRRKVKPTPRSVGADSDLTKQKGKVIGNKNANDHAVKQTCLKSCHLSQRGKLLARRGAQIRRPLKYRAD